MVLGLWLHQNHLGILLKYTLQSPTPSVPDSVDLGGDSCSHMILFWQLHVRKHDIQEQLQLYGGKSVVDYNSQKIHPICI